MTTHLEIEPIMSGKGDSNPRKTLPLRPHQIPSLAASTLLAHSLIFCGPDRIRTDLIFSGDSGADTLASPKANIFSIKKPS